MLSCAEVTRLVSESLDRRLPLSQRVAVRMHLTFCSACTRYRRQLLFIRQAVQQLEADIEKAASAVAPSLTPEARERMKRSLRSISGDAAPEQA